MEISKEYIHPVDYNAPNLSEAFKTLNPIVYREGDAYCCISGDNPIEGIFGCGNTPEEAIDDWEKSYKKKKGG